mgnify:CR=1 FL=1
MKLKWVLLKNEYIDSNSIPSVLYSTRDTKYISNYIKTVNDLKILFDILSILRRREFPDYEILKKTIYNKVGLYIRNNYKHIIILLHRDYLSYCKNMFIGIIMRYMYVNQLYNSLNLLKISIICVKS